MKKRILPFIIAMSAALSIQSFAPANVEASAVENNKSQWKVVWQSSDTVVKYKVVKWQPMKYSNGSYLQKKEVAPVQVKQQEQPQAAIEQKPVAKTEAKPVVPAETKQETIPVQKAETKVEQAPSVAPQKEVDSSISNVEQEIVRLVNVERAKEGLQPLTMDVELQKVAKKKSEDMKAKNYFSHTSPTYGSPFDMMKQFGITYKSAGENIAKGQTTAQQVMDAWMNSAGHRANIMSTSFTHIGVGYVKSGHYWTQMFIKK